MPGKVGADRDAVDGLDRADDVRRRGPLLLLRHHAGDGLRRRLESGGVNCRLNLLELYETQSREQDCHHAQHQDHSFRHNFPLARDRDRCVGAPDGQLRPTAHDLCFEKSVPDLIHNLRGRIRANLFGATSPDKTLTKCPDQSWNTSVTSRPNDLRAMICYPDGSRFNPQRRDGRVAEGARLESVYTFTGIGGSNPSLSAILPVDGGTRP